MPGDMGARRAGTSLRRLYLFGNGTLPDNLQAMHIWQICDIHARDFVGMSGQARPIRLEAVRAECDRTDDPEGNFQKVMLIEAVLFPSRYLKK